MNTVNLPVADLVASLQLDNPDDPAVRPLTYKGLGIRNYVNQHNVDQLVESIADIGLQHPIGVCSDGNGGHRVIVGKHRLLAFHKLERGEIPCVLLDNMSEADRELWEIDENVRRAGLDTMELGKAVKRRIAILAEMRAGNIERMEDAQNYAVGTITISEPNKRQRLRKKLRKKGIPLPPSPRSLRGTAARDTAKMLGVSVRSVQKYIEKSNETPDQTVIRQKKDRITHIVHHLYDCLITLPADWPEVRHRVEEKLGKTIIERINELNGAASDVVVECA